MKFFTCPICKSPFEQRGRSLVCPKNHCFDLSKQGYVNLLRPAKSGSVRHGDDKLMVGARSAFLGTGFYNILRNTVTETVCAHASENPVVLDAGCGEGFYTSHIREALGDSASYTVLTSPEMPSTPPRGTESSVLPSRAFLIFRRKTKAWIFC